MPLPGVVFAASLFGIALRSRSVPFQRLALVPVFLLAPAAIPVYRSGESAAHAVERVSGRRLKIRSGEPRPGGVDNSAA